MSGLGEQIAVLDGIRLDPNDGRLGQQRARVDQYVKAIARNVLRQRPMPSTDGALYGGGSSYYPGGALMPSSVGLAGLRGLRNIPGVLPPLFNVISPSGGVNYSGGSSYARGMPLLPSSAGLAAALIDGGYGRAGLGSAHINGGYGRAGLGGTGTAADEDLAAAAEAVAVARRLDPTDGRLGQHRARVDEYGRAVTQGVLERSNVIDPSEGANYGGGSDYYPGAPLLPSSAGLAGFAGCGCPSGGLSGLGAVGVSRAQLLAHYGKLKGLAHIYLRMAKGGQTAARRADGKRKANATLIAMCRLRVSLNLPMNQDCIARMRKAAPSSPVTRMRRAAPSSPVTRYGNIGARVAQIAANAGWR